MPVEVSQFVVGLDKSMCNNVKIAIGEVIIAFSRIDQQSNDDGHLIKIVCKPS